MNIEAHLIAVAYARVETHKKNDASIEFSGSAEQGLVAQAAESLRAQKEIEDADTLTFADFLMLITRVNLN